MNERINELAGVDRKMADEPSEVGVPDSIFEDREAWIGLEKAREETARRAMGTSLPDGYYPFARHGGFCIAKRGVTSRKYRQGV